MAPQGKAHFQAAHRALDSPPDRCPCTSDPWASSCASGWDLLHRNCNTRTGCHRTHSRNNPAGRQRIRTAYRAPATRGPLRSAATNSAARTTPMTVTSSWSAGVTTFGEVIFSHSTDQAMTRGIRVIDVDQIDGSSFWRTASKWLAQVQWLNWRSRPNQSNYLQSTVFTPCGDPLDGERNEHTISYRTCARAPMLPRRLWWHLWSSATR